MPPLVGLFSLLAAPLFTGGAHPAVTIAPAAASLLQEGGEQATDARVLFLTHSAGFTHGVVRRPAGGALALAETQLVKAAAGRFEVVATQDCSTINAQTLGEFDAVVFYTTGELPIDEPQRLELMEWVRGGGAFVGLHCATDTWYEFPAYMEMIGAAFAGHPWTQKVGVVVEQSSHPAVRHLGSRFEIDDEIYQFRAFQGEPPLRVMLSLDMDSVDASRGRNARNPIAWWRDWGEGRVVYSALGHRPEVWRDERFLTHVIQSLHWAIHGPDVMAPMPAGARRILSGGNTDGWKHKDGEPFAWRRSKSVVEVVAGTGDLVSEEEFGDFLLHVEFSVPEGANSGVYLHGRYEVQVLDSYGRSADKLRTGDCGGVYGQRVPSVVASRAPDRWQSFDIRFRAPRITDARGKTDNARITLWHNGLLVHDDVELTGATAGGLDANEYHAGPILLQDHGSPVRFRNVWILPEDE